MAIRQNSAFFFWSNWPTPYKVLYLFLGTLALIVLGALCYILASGESLYLNWFVNELPEFITIPGAIMDLAGLEYNLPNQYVLVKQEFVPSNYTINWDSLDICAAIYFLGFVILLTTVSEFSFIGYLISIGYLSFTLVALNLDALGIGREVHPKLLLGVVLLVFIGSTYLFRTIGSYVSAWKRFAFFLFLGLITLYCFGTYSSIDKPFHSLFLQGLTFSSGFYLLWLIWISFEVPRGIFWIFTSGKAIRSNSTFFNIIIVLVLYFLNLVYLYFSTYQSLDLDLFHIGIYPLVILSAVLAFVGLKDREVEYKPLFDFAPTGALTYLGLLFSGLAVWAAPHLTGNTALITTYQKSTLYVLTGFGLIYVLYLLSAHAEKLLQNKQVYKELFSNPSVDSGTVYLAGTVAVAVFFWSDNFIQYPKLISGYYTNLGDYERRIESPGTALEYYKLASTYNKSNTKAYLSRAEILMEGNRLVEAQNVLQSGLLVARNPFHYAKLASLQSRRNRFLESLLTLDKGIERVEENGELLNNIGILYDQTNLKDSVIRYYELANKATGNNSVVQSNQLAFLAKYGYEAKLNTRNFTSETERTNLIAYLAESGYNDNGASDSSSIEAIRSPYLLHNLAWRSPQMVADSLLINPEQNFGNMAVGMDMAHVHNLFVSGDLIRAFKRADVLLANDRGDQFTLLYLGFRFVQFGRFELGLKLLRSAQSRGGVNIENLITQLEPFEEMLDNRGVLLEAYNQCVITNSCSESWKVIARNQLIESPHDTDLPNNLKVLRNSIFTMPTTEVNQSVYTVSDNPFDETGFARQTWQIYSNHGLDSAYHNLVPALQINPESIVLNELYIRLAAESGYSNYAYNALSTIEEALTVQRTEQLRALIQKYDNQELSF